MPDLYIAAGRFVDTAAVIILSVALLLTTSAFVTMRLYLRAIFRESQLPAKGNLSSAEVAIQSVPPGARGCLETQTEGPDAAARRGSARSRIFRNAETAFCHAASFYALGGLILAASSAALLFALGSYSVPSFPSTLTSLACYGGIVWSWCFFTVVALALFVGPSRRFRALLLFGYVSALFALGLLLELVNAPALPLTDVGLMPEKELAFVLAFISSTGQNVTPAVVTFSPLLQPILFWSLSAAPVTIPLLVFNRFVRATVGPLLINLALIMVVTTFLAIDLILGTSPGIWLAAHIKARFGDSTLEVLMVISIVLSLVASGFGLVWMAHRYRRKQLSDQTFLLDALWLLASLWVTVRLMGHSSTFAYLLGLLPFILCKITVGYGLKRVAARAEALPNIRLLFLRVFGSPSRSERLFDLLAAHWRYAGSIQLISATDVARSRFEPDEFLDFLGGRLKRAYISTSADLDRRIAGCDLRPDPDGRYRVNEFFCRVDTWQQTVRRLMATNDVIVMDLRGFGGKNKGCIFELGTMIDQVPLHRVVLLVDRTTDQVLLKEILAHLWGKMSPQSPNAHSGFTRIRVINLACGYPAAVHRLMQLGDEFAVNGSQLA